VKGKVTSIKDKKIYYALSPLEAIGIHFILKKSVKIESICSSSGKSISFKVDVL
jgi:hypothetical protein